MVAYQLDESQVTYRVPAGLITRVNGCYNDGATTYKFNNGEREALATSGDCKSSTLRYTGFESLVLHHTPR